jgi:Na+/proline symporter
MFWKVVVFLSFFGILLSAVILIFSIRTLTDEKAPDAIKDIAVVGLLVGIVLLLISLLFIFLGVIFILRASKREFDAKNKPKEN